MESTNNNNNQLLFLSEFKELRKELSAVKKRIVQLEESHEKQQERLNILERENRALGGSALKRKRTDQYQNPEEETVESESKSTSVSNGKKKTKTNNSNIDDEEAVVVSRYDNGDSFDSLSDDLLHKIVEFNGNCYEKFGSINKRCRNIYDVKEYKLKKQTCVYGYGTVDMMLQHILQKRREEEGELDHDVRSDIAYAVIRYNRLDAIDWIIQLGDSDLLIQLCCNAAYNGRIDILTKVFCKCNLTMLDELLDDTFLCYQTAWSGQLETMKWLRKYGAECNAGTFSRARGSGHGEMVRYLRAEGYEDNEDGEY